MTRSAVLTAYKNILKAANKTFSGDLASLEKAKELARAEFRIPLSDDSALVRRLSEAEETARFLRKNFVQATYKGDNCYKLNFTAETEINDKIEPVKTKRRCC